MRFQRNHPDQLPLDWSKDAEIERIIEARVAIRAETAALRWRFRLILIETVLLACLMLAAGLVLDRPTGMVLRATAMVSAACLVGGLLLIALSALTGRLVARIRRRRGK